MKKYITNIILIIFSLWTLASYANPPKVRKTITILTWWGEYFSYPEIIKLAENKCAVNISKDEYYSEDEFLRRLEGQEEYYDVITASDVVYNVIKNKIPYPKNSNLSKLSSYYHPVIKSHYDKKKYPHNVAYYEVSIRGFLWNPANIKISPNDSISSIFKNAKTKNVILVDDPTEIMKLIDASLDVGTSKKGINTKLSLETFKKLTQESNIIILSSYNTIFERQNFAFSFRWAGPTVNRLIKPHFGYKFLIHPKLTYIAPKLLIQMTAKKEASCVAEFFASRKLVRDMQKKVFVFSPYVDFANVNDPISQSMYKQYTDMLPSAEWLDDDYKYNFREINRSLQLIKLSLNHSLRIHDI